MQSQYKYIKGIQRQVVQSPDTIVKVDRVRNCNFSLNVITKRIQLLECDHKVLQVITSFVDALSICDHRLKIFSIKRNSKRIV